MSVVAMDLISSSRPRRGTIAMAFSALGYIMCLIGDPDGGGAQR